MVKPDSLLIFFWIFLLKNGVSIFLHNRLNAFLYLLLLTCYFVLRGRQGLRDWRVWLVAGIIPYALALYYLDFGLILATLVLDLILLGGFFIFEKKRS